MPTVPHSAAGWRIDPPVSEPSAAIARSAATAAADPPDDPPGTRSRSQGLRTGWKAEFSFDDPIANSSMLALPRNTAPASRSRSTTQASYGGTKSARIRLAQVVLTPRVARTSFKAIGMPVSGPPVPAAIRSSAARACSRANSSVTSR